MTNTKRAVVAGVTSVLLVGFAQVVLAQDNLLGAVILLPGGMINMFTVGVHGRWNPYVTVLPSAVAWFAVIFIVHTTFDYLVQKKSEAKSRSRRPENNARDLT